MPSRTALLLLAHGTSVVSALCTGPASCRIIGVVLLTFFLSLGQLSYIITISVLLGISCCNKHAKNTHPNAGLCCGFQQGMLFFFAILAIPICGFQTFWSIWVADTLTMNAGSYCTTDAAEIEAAGATGESCSRPVYEDRDWDNNATTPDTWEATNLTLPGVTINYSRWDDLWPWFAWNVVLAVADASLCAAALFWRHALISKDESLKNRIEGFADYGTSSGRSA